MKKLLFLLSICLLVFTTTSCKKEIVTPNNEKSEALVTPQLNGDWDVMATEVMTISGTDTTRVYNDFEDSLTKNVVNVYAESYTTQYEPMTINGINFRLITGGETVSTNTVYSFVISASMLNPTNGSTYYYLLGKRR